MPSDDFLSDPEGHVGTVGVPQQPARVVSQRHGIGAPLDVRYRAAERDVGRDVAHQLPFAVDPATSGDQQGRVAPDLVLERAMAAANAGSRTINIGPSATDADEAQLVLAWLQDEFKIIDHEVVAVHDVLNCSQCRLGEPHQRDPRRRKQIHAVTLAVAHRDAIWLSVGLLAPVKGDGTDLRLPPHVQEAEDASGGQGLTAFSVRELAGQRSLQGRRARPRRKLGRHLT
mmetsp:Transcript_38017/g.104563  ORF Transcript_38017/g.104563 Transcript_38017/m.104563 type:complete len:229 (+) Transcript_38017:631-1317(+)